MRALRAEPHPFPLPLPVPGMTPRGAGPRPIRVAAPQPPALTALSKQPLVPVLGGALSPGAGCPGSPMPGRARSSSLPCFLAREALLLLSALSHSPGRAAAGSQVHRKDDPRTLSACSSDLRSQHQRPGRCGRAGSPLTALGTRSPACPRGGEGAREDREPLLRPTQLLLSL